MKHLESLIRNVFSQAKSMKLNYMQNPISATSAKVYDRITLTASAFSLRKWGWKQSRTQLDIATQLDVANTLQLAAPRVRGSSIDARFQLQ